MNRIPVHIKPFQGDEHQPFYWNGGQPAALLVHGFPGTPAEMRALGTALHHAGWTVEAPLLPGFGPNIVTLFERDYTEWIAAIGLKLTELKKKHHPVMLIGHSMGAAVSLNVVAAWAENLLSTNAQRGIGLLLKPFLRQIRPFKKVDFTDPQVRHGINNFLPDVDLDDPDIQAEIRDFSIPTRIFEQLVRVGNEAYRVAPHINTPTLIVQGTQDNTVPAHRTRRLLQRLPGPVHYEETNTGHDLTRADDPGWPDVRRAVISFSQTVLN